MTENQLRKTMETHGDTVYRLALCRLRNAADAEDVYQDVFLRLFGQDTESWDAERTKAWLIRATLNRCADLYRFRLRRPTLPLEEIAAALSVPAATVRTRLHRARGKLKELLGGFDDEA